MGSTDLLKQTFSTGGGAKVKAEVEMPILASGRSSPPPNFVFIALLLHCHSNIPALSLSVGAALLRRTRDRFQTR